MENKTPLNILFPVLKDPVKILVVGYMDILLRGMKAILSGKVM